MLFHVRGNRLYFRNGRNRNTQTHAGTICSEEDVEFKGGGAEVSVPETAKKQKI